MNPINLENYQKEFIHNLELKGKSFNTIKNYRTDLNIFKEFLTSKGRKLEINEITLAESKDYAYFLNNKYSSPNSIRRRIQALRLFFDFLIELGHFSENPVKKIPVAPKVVDLPNPVSFSDIRKIKNDLLSQMSKRNLHEGLLLKRNLLLFHLIYGAGLKVSDIEGLYPRNITKRKGIYRVLVSPEKRDPYTITLPETFNEFYEEYIELLDQGKQLSKIEFPHLLFNGNPFKILSGGLSARGIEIIFKELSKSHDIKISAKNLRQACIFKWITMDLPHSRVKEWMGVQPQYSLKPYLDLIENEPDKYSYMDE